MSNHPNATAAAIAGALVTLILYAADALAGIDAPDTVENALLTLVLAAVLFVGRRDPAA